MLAKQIACPFASHHHAAAPEGIRAVTAAYPEVAIVISEVDPGLNENVSVAHLLALARHGHRVLVDDFSLHMFCILQKKVSPGVGDFANRYFCTED